VQDSKKTNLRSSDHALVFVTQGLENRPENVEISSCDWFEFATRLEPPHADPGVVDVALYTFCLTVEHLDSGTEEKHDGGRE